MSSAYETPDNKKEGLLVAARMAVRSGLHEFACQLYEKIITGDDYDDLREKYGDIAVSKAISVVMASPEDKIGNIKSVREVSNIGLRDSKDLVEQVADRIKRKIIEG